MSTLPITLPQPRSASRPLLRRLGAPRPEQAGLLFTAAILFAWSLSTNGWANTYYSAAARSMAGSWHNFLYASFDAQGVMTVDKPPLAFWLQALSVRAFGLHSWSILLPQVLEAIAAVGLTYAVVVRRFGRAAATVAGAALALTPITVAMARHNNPDMALTLCMVAAAYFAVRALEDGRTRWIVLTGVMVGLGFETKMGAALLIVPAIAAAYAWVAPAGRGRAGAQLVAGGAAMTAVALAWPVLVWLTPASQRPWVSGTTDNSIWSLILDYNGLGRLDGQSGGPSGTSGGGGGGGTFGGATGPFRLLNDALGGQAGWLLGTALVAGLGILAACRLRRSDPRTGWLMLVGGMFATTAVAFSTAQGIFHPYYVVELAPFTAMLVGAGVGLALRPGLAARLFTAAAIAAGVATELVILGSTPTAVTVAIAALGAGVVHLAGAGTGLRRGALSVAVAALLWMPASWSVQTLSHATGTTFPAGGPTSAQQAGMGGGQGGTPPGAGRTGFGPSSATASNRVTVSTASTSSSESGTTGAMGGAGMGGDDASVTTALSYISKHGGGTLAISSQNGASQAITSGATDLVAIGGFSGRESQVTAAWLAAQVKAGTIRYVLVDSSSSGLPNDTRTGATDVLAAAKKVGKAIEVSSTVTVYDLQGTAAALAAG